MPRTGTAKKPTGGGPQKHPSNEGPGTTAGHRNSGGAPHRGGSKVRQGRGSDTGNKGKG